MTSLRERIIRKIEQKRDRYMEDIKHVTPNSDSSYALTCMVNACIEILRIVREEPER